MRAARDVALQLRLGDNGVTLAAVETIIEELVKARRIEEVSLPGLSDDRVPVFPGGMAILAEVMSALKVEILDISSGALREGLVYDMLGRLNDEDARERSIRAMQRRYHVDLEQAARVEATAAALLDDVAKDWGLRDDRLRKLLDSVGSDTAAAADADADAESAADGDNEFSSELRTATRQRSALLHSIPAPAARQSESVAGITRLRQRR